MKFGGSALLPLNAALCDKAKFLGFSKFNLFGQSFFGFGKSTFSDQILESLKPQNMPKFVKLPQYKSHLVVETFRAQSVERASLRKAGIC